MARKGVSPVLASLLLVAIAAAAAIATYVWVSSYLGSAGRGAEAPQLRELLKVEGVRVEGGSVVVTVRNIGSAKATLRAAYLMKEGVAAASETLNVELEPGQAVDVKVSAQVPPGSYTVKIVTATGVEAIAPLPLSEAAQQPAQPEATLTVSVEPPEGGTTSPPPGEYRVAAGSAVTVRAEPNPGYAFSKWLLNGSVYSTSQEVTVTVRGPTSLTAVFSMLQATELVRNGDFSEGSAYWTLEDPWRVDPQQYARAQVKTNRDFEASIYQDVEIPAGTTSLTLSFSYYLAAHPPGQVEKGGLTLKAYLLSGGNVVWESSTIQWDGRETPVWKQFTQTFTVSVTGTVTLRITLTADVREVGTPATIDAGLDNISLVASAPP
jgi:flagellin-like protein